MNRDRIGRHERRPEWTNDREAVKRSMLDAIERSGYQGRHRP